MVSIAAQDNSLHGDESCLRRLIVENNRSVCFSRYSGSFEFLVKRKQFWKTEDLGGSHILDVAEEHGWKGGNGCSLQVWFRA
jgi:hypothetical protein